MSNFKKMAITMLISKKTGHANDQSIKQLLASLPSELSNEVKQELKNMHDFSLDQLNIELTKVS